MVLIRGVDYSFGRPDPKKLKALGFDFAARYLSGGVSNKDITATEFAQLRIARLAVVLVWEGGGEAAKGGFRQGVVDARGALRQLADLNFGLDRPVYFAVDFDAGATTSTLNTAVEYVRGAASVLGAARTGVYGGLKVTEACLNGGVCKFGWQTYAWSGGKWGSAQLRQTSNGQSVAGGTVDLCVAVATDYGQWPAPAQPVPDVKPPVVIPPVSHLPGANPSVKDEEMIVIQDAITQACYAWPLMTQIDYPTLTVLRGAGATVASLPSAVVAEFRKDAGR